MQEEVMDGKYIQTEEELYNLLESYSQLMWFHKKISRNLCRNPVKRMGQK